MQNQQIAHIEEDEIDLRELFNTILKSKFKIMAITFVITSFAILYALSIPNSYKSSIILAPQEESKGSLGGLGALAGLAGVGLGGSGMDVHNSMSTILGDNSFQQMVVEKHNLIEKLDPKNTDKNLVFALNSRAVYDFLKSDSKEEEEAISEEEAMFNTIKDLKTIVSLSSDKDSGALTMGVELQDRFLAKEILEIYLKETTAYLRILDMKDINEKLEYYKDELSKINDIELKVQISQLMSSLIQKKVLSSASEYYNVKIMTKPQVAYIKDKSKPKRALIVVVSFVTSIILSIFIVFFLEFIRQDEKDKTVS